MKRGFFNYRLLGNCFAVCLVNGLQFLGDKKLDCEIPELQIFNIETLNGTDETLEFAPALNYLINNKYEVKVIDPDPFKNNLWGKNIDKVNLESPYRNYTLGDIESLNKKGWVVIFSTIDLKKHMSHANLVFNFKIYDPMHQTIWEKPIPWDDLEAIISRVKEKFCIAFKKLV